MIRKIENSPVERRVQNDNPIAKERSSTIDSTIPANEIQQNNEIKTSWTVHDLLNTQFSEPDWVVPGIIPIGLTALGGRPKIGKSFLGIDLAISKSVGRSFLGKDLSPGKVLYLALEDRPRRIKERLTLLNAPDNAPVQFEFVYPNLMQTGLQILNRMILEEKYSLVVIDTLSRVMGRLDQDDIREMSEVFCSLQTIAQNLEISIIGIDHHRKPNGSVHDPIDDLLGSTGKSAPLDTVLGLYRDRGQHDAKLMVVGRDVDDQDFKLVWNRQKCIWSLANELGGDSSRKNIVYDAIKELSNKGELPTTSNISGKTNLGTSNVSHEINELLNIGKISKGTKIGRLQPYYPDLKDSKQ